MSYEPQTQAEWRQLLSDAVQAIPLLTRAVIRYFLTGGNIVSGALVLPQAGLDLVCPFTYSGQDPPVGERLEYYHPVINIAKITGDRNAINLTFDALVWQVPIITPNSVGNGDTFVRHFANLFYFNKPKEYATQLIIDALNHQDEAVLLAAIAVTNMVEKWEGKARHDVIESLSRRFDVPFVKFAGNTQVFRLLANIASASDDPKLFSWLPDRIAQATINSPWIWERFGLEGDDWSGNALRLLVLSDHARDALDRLKAVAIPEQRLSSLLRTASLAYHRFRTAHAREELRMAENPDALRRFMPPVPKRGLYQAGRRQLY